MALDILGELHRIFIGPHHSIGLVCEIVFRTCVLYFYALASLRIIGKQGMNQLTPFQFIIVVALGTAMGDPMCYQNIPLVNGMIVVTLVTLLEYFTLYMMEKSMFMHAIIEGQPTLVIKSGKILFNALKKENLSPFDLYEMLRLKGIQDTGQVEYAFLESSGNLSVIKKERASVEQSTIKVVLDDKIS